MMKGINDVDLMKFHVLMGIVASTLKEGVDFD